MSDRVCLRGCTVRGAHYATCPDYGATSEDVTCRGCAPRECRDGSLICDRCFGRMRGLLNDAPDLLGRLRAIGDPSKAAVFDAVRSGASSPEPVAPVGADLLDAIRVVELVIDVMAGRDLAAVSNDHRTVSWLSAVVLDRHAPVDGVRSGWSVQDAVDRWGVERVDRNPAPVPEDDGDVTTYPIPEWGDPLLNREQAEELVGSARTLRRWVQKDLVKPEGQIWTGGKLTQLFRWSDLVETARVVRDRTSPPRKEQS